MVSLSSLLRCSFGYGVVINKRSKIFWILKTEVGTLDASWKIKLSSPSLSSPNPRRPSRQSAPLLSRTPLLPSLRSHQVPLPKFPNLLTSTTICCPHLMTRRIPLAQAVLPNSNNPTPSQATPARTETDLSLCTLFPITFAALRSSILSYFTIRHSTLPLVF